MFLHYDSYVLLEQTAIAATLLPREVGEVWTPTAHTTGELMLREPNLSVPLSDIYQGLTFRVSE